MNRFILVLLYFFGFSCAIWLYLSSLFYFIVRPPELVYAVRYHLMLQSWQKKLFSSATDLFLNWFISIPNIYTLIVTQKGPNNCSAGKYLRVQDHLKKNFTIYFTIYLIVEQITISQILVSSPSSRQVLKLQIRCSELQIRDCINCSFCKYQACDELVISRPQRLDFCYLANLLKNVEASASYLFGSQVVDPQTKRLLFSRLQSGCHCALLTAYAGRHVTGQAGLITFKLNGFLAESEKIKGQC